MAQTDRSATDKSAADTPDELKAVKQDLEQLRAEIANLTGDLKKLGSRAASEAGRRGRAKAAEVQDDLESMVDDAYDRGREQLDAVSRTVQERPGMAMLIAFTTGLLCSKLLDRR